MHHVPLNAHPLRRATAHSPGRWRALKKDIMVMVKQVLMSIVLNTSGLALFGQSESHSCTYQIDTISGQKIYTWVDQMPEPEGGEEILVAQFFKDVKIGSIPKDQILGSLTIVSFIVTESGQIIDK